MEKYKYFKDRISYLNALKRQDNLTSFGEQELQELLEIEQILNQNASDKKLSDKVFELANELAIAGHGDEAVMMHHIHNNLSEHEN